MLLAAGRGAQTPMERYDLIMGINARGTFATTQACLKYMREAGFGHVITQSPPVTLDKLKGMTAYVAWPTWAPGVRSCGCCA